MQYAYEDAYRGDSLFGKLLHKHVSESAAAQAVRSRRCLVTDAIAQARRDVDERLRFISVACGPAWELGDLLLTPEDCYAYEIALLDQDDEALGDAARKVAEAERRAGGRAAVRYVHASVRNLLRDREIAESLGRYHVVYSMGLFDYLTAPVAKALLGKLYE